MISFDNNKYTKLRKAYKTALNDGKKSFVFEGHEVLVSYAKYLLEYLETQLRVK